MGCLYKALFRAKAHKGWTLLLVPELLDLGIHADFIAYDGQGVSLNVITFWKPTHIFRSDACEFGLGGYNVKSGLAWRWELPLDLRLRTSINSLEFLAYVITIWLAVKATQIAPEDCVLSQTDNTSAAGWLRKSNFADVEDEFVQNATARHLAFLLIKIKSKSCIHSQWVPGDFNNISDSLSRDFHLDSSNLANLLVHHFPEQTPFGLAIHPLPNKIVSWVTSLLQSQPQAELWSKEPVQSKFMLGQDLNPTYAPSGLLLTSTSMASTGVFVTRSCVPLHTPSEKVDYVLNLPSFSSLSRSVPPWIAWHRPSSWLTGQTHAWMQTESLHSFDSASLEDTSPPILEKNPKQQ
jgi:hypothetical protein